MEDCKIRELVEAISGKMIQGDLNALVNQISIDTRTLVPGDLFFALIGPNFNGHNFVLDAFRKRASGVIVEKNYYYIKLIINITI